MIWLQIRVLAAVIILALGVLAGRQGRATTSGAAMACNNSPDLCNRTYNNITHMGAHDSAFVRDASTGNSIAGNQYYNATIALSAGIRLLQAQVHLSSNKLRLCHTDCRILDAGPLEDWLAHIKHWLDANPNEVVTLLLVNSNDQPASSFGAAFTRSGIEKYAYTPLSSSSSSSPNTSSSNPVTTWPTLRALIGANTRLITFIASLPTPPSQSYPYLLDEFSHVFETAYDVSTTDPFSCALDRPKNITTSSSSSSSPATQAIAAGLLPLVNHFAYLRITRDASIPAAGGVDATNSPSRTGARALGRHVADCAAQWGGAGGKGNGGDGGNGGRVPVVFVLVDFYDRGPALAAADEMNGITPMGRRKEPAVAAAAAGVRESRGWVYGMVWSVLGLVLFRDMFVFRWLWV